MFFKENDSAFNWYDTTKTWCLSGETKDGLLWETDDYEADNEREARLAAIEYLKAFLSQD